ncbi:MAG: hypothetical protein CMD88_01495 [Gammaproteobacteria bacterium]|nr:hypothetical protein [Gammaproteobacteria bacterium]|tara:strand:+ start:213813 stop:214994 length:1182 start_codon:yes stop_codon:yes gene_type:complete
MSDIIIVLLVIFLLSIGYIFRKPEIKKTKTVFNAEYYRGLNYLLSNEEDKALKIFTALIEVDSSTIETHLALGGLYRRRGEFDKAILIHQNLLSRPTLEQELKNQANYELARDFFSAGLYDRSEKIFKDLSENKTYRQSSLEYLLLIYELMKDWDKAIDFAKSLGVEKYNGTSVDALVAQYHCEKSDMYLSASEIDRAIAISKKALKINPKCIRANIQLAENNINNDMQLSIEYYLEIIQQDIRFGFFVITKILDIAKKLDDQNFTNNIIDKITQNTQLGFLPEIYIYLHHQNNQESAEFYASKYDKHNDVNRFIVSLTKMQLLSSDEETPLTSKISESFNQLSTNHLGYICSNCGYKSKTLNWNCPSCNKWESIVPNSLIDILDNKSETINV